MERLRSRGQRRRVYKYKKDKLSSNHVNKIIMIKHPKTRRLKYVWITKYVGGVASARFPRFGTSLFDILKKTSKHFHYAIELPKKIKVYSRIK